MSDSLVVSKVVVVSLLEAVALAVSNVVVVSLLVPVLLEDSLEV